MYYALDEHSALDYVRQSPVMATIFGDHDDLTSVDLAEGNVNLIFRVYRAGAPDTTVLVKQALPHARRFPEFKMPLERSRLEHDLLEIEARYSPEHVPNVYLYDDDMHLMIMEDLNKHLIMRDGLMQQRRYPRVAEDIGRFMARTLFYTSDLHLASDEKKAMAARFINPVMCQVQEDLVFTQPFMNHPGNRWTPLLDRQVERIHADDTLRSEILTLKEAYMAHAQSLIHNDLHTGSIMLNEHDTKVIDPEFAFYGPIGHDVGSYLGNLALSYASQEYHAAGVEDCIDYRQWLCDTLAATWNRFGSEFLMLWEEHGNAGWPSPGFRARYMRRLLQDTAGFGAAEMMRRLIGLAHVPDLDSIPDERVRARAESVALNAAQAWLKNREGITSSADLVDLLRGAEPDSSVA